MDINLENVNQMREEYPESVLNKAAGCAALFNVIRWKHVTFIIDTTPKASKRPRLSGYRVYVPGAAKNAAFFNNNVLPMLQDIFIETPCKVDVDYFMQTPESFTKTQKLLAEMKILRPWTNTGDIDNLLKSTFDQIQPNAKRGHRGIMENDCLIIETHARKFYSKHPRTEVHIAWMGKIPESIQNVLRLKMTA